MRRLDYPQLGEGCYFERLSSGLPVFVVPRPGYARAMAMLAVSYGGMDAVFTRNGEKQTTPEGIAHYLEHKMFDMKEGNALTRLSRNGASVNAFTANDITAYHFTSTAHFEENLRTLLRFVTTPYFTPESVEKERGIIAQEIRMYRDDPGHRVYENLLSHLYTAHPIRRSVAGTEASIAEITEKTLYELHRAFYTPENMVLIVVGDVDPRRVLELASLVVPEQKSDSIVKDYGEDEPGESAETLVEETMEVPEPTFLLGCKGIPFPLGEEGLRRSILADVAAELLCGESSPLYARLYREGLIHKDFSAGCLDYPGAAMFVAGGDSPDPEAVAAALFQESARLAAEGIPEAQFQRVLRSSYGAMVRSLNSFDSICVQLARGWFAGYHFFDFPRLYEALTAREAAAYLKETIQPLQSCLSVIRPKGGEEA